MGVLLTKSEKYDQALDAHRTEVKKELDVFDKRAKRREQDAKKRQSQEIDDLAKTVSEFQAKFNAFSKVREELIVRKEDENQRTQLISELKEKVDKIEISEGERVSTFNSLEEDRRQDKKRLADLQAEISSLRKRTDEHRGKLDLVTEGQKKSDARLNEIVAIDDERRGSQNEFVEKSMISIHEADLAIKQAQHEFNEITEQLNRRIHEITEMQRLGEERFRQEWSTFKADDQKRWTNYALTQDEQHKEMNRRIENLTDRTTNLEENSQDLQDAVQQLSEQTGKLMQNLMTGLREWLAESDSFESSVR
jgi:DNA repair exonuclease SbcCD ATPase subunit